jgi:hypothetical protein
MTIYISELKKKQYIDLLEINKNNINLIVQKDIENLIHNDKNVCNNQLKLLERFELNLMPLYISFKCTYSLSYLIMEIYIFSEEPHIMVNGEIYLHFYSIICHQKQYLEVHQSQLHLSLQKLFEMTFDKIFKK